VAYKTTASLITEIKRRKDVASAQKEKERTDELWKKMPRRGQL
jgi:hypothetical protein